MRRVWLAILVLVAACLASCLPVQSVGTSIWRASPRPATAVRGPDVVETVVMPLIVPVGDRYANEELWTAVDEQVLPAATRVLLQENGLRIGLVPGGRTPDGLRRLFASKKSLGDNSYRFIRSSGTAVTAQLLGPMPQCEFPLRLDGNTEVRRFEQVRCKIEIVPTLDGDDKVRLSFTPQVEYDDAEKWTRLNPNLALAVQGHRSTESFAPLRWEVSVAPNEYVVVGARFDKPDSLGFRFFVNPDPDQPAQRLLAVRAGRSSPRARASAGPAGAHALAAQAASR